ncbi:MULTISPECIES: bacterioferritin [unclassified Adlercreutzia]|uniref:bacterioferritin n=1 Tax=unclassified Adlercreutzia TaxID=2636013 RepID=UPI0013EB03B0|nr:MULTISPECIES: bacterioferritin [unclassified Adlercreutzia]
MKGNQKLIDKLNSLLADELTSINQYMVHAEMCEDWGYGKLSENVKRHAIDEMKHAERLIERILFLEGAPIVSKLHAMHIGADVPAQVENDLELEIHAVEEYNDAIVLAAEAMDHATRDLLIGILADEDKHVDYLEELQDQIDQMGLPVFLSTQA